MRFLRTNALLVFVLLMTWVGLEGDAPGLEPTDKDVSQLLNGVQKIPVPGSPGTIIPFGPDAFPLIVGDVGNGNVLPVVAGARLGKGRIVAFSHGSYLFDVTSDDLKRLILNAVQWTSGGPSGKKQDKRRVMTYRYSELTKVLKENGLNVTEMKTIAGIWEKELKDCDVLCIDSSFADNPGLAEGVAKFVKSGGGLVTAGTGWGWAQLNPGKSLTDDYPGNRVLRAAGLSVADIMAGGTGGHFVVQRPPPELASAWGALALIRDIKLKDPNNQKFKAISMTQAYCALEAAISTVPPSDTILWPRVREMVKGMWAVPRPGFPIDAKNPLARLVVVVEDRELSQLTPAEVKRHPSAVGFPFAVPDNALQKTAKRDVDTSVPAWHSLGLYAAPGALISVIVPNAALNAKMMVQIGCHTDTLWHLPTWERWPNICRRVNITAATTQIASPFGGLVYINVPENCQAGTVQVTIDGAVEAPLYVLGKTNLADWKNRIRNLPGPWAEFACSGVIVTVPSISIRTLDDPKPVMEFWNRAVELQDELAMYKPGERKRPERIVADQQISAGYMHSGYPIMVGNDMYDYNINIAKLRGTTKQPGGWGHWHELGHNHQFSDWTTRSTTEVTCNLFTLYVMNKLHGVPLDVANPDHLSAEKRRIKIHAYLASNRNANEWDPFEGLVMYYQLVDAFGWQKLQEVFAEYRKLGPNEHPKTEVEKWDQWMVRYSRLVNRNLGPFFILWKVPVTKPALDSISGLPQWIHSDFDGI